MPGLGAQSSASYSAVLACESRQSGVALVSAVDVATVCRFCCLCWHRFGATHRVPIKREKVPSKRLWDVARVGRSTSVMKQLLMTVVFIALLVALIFMFIAQFGWFPWPDDADQPEADRLMIGGKKPDDFFRECASAHGSLMRPSNGSTRADLQRLLLERAFCVTARS